MQYLALATDYDGTLATLGKVPDAAERALHRLRKTGRKLLLVTGRQLEDLFNVCSCVDLFDLVVVENGALIYRPDSREIELLTKPPSFELVQALREKRVNPLDVGRAIIATTIPFKETVQEAIVDLNLNLQVILNKDAVMVLPAGVDKLSGLKVALERLSIDRRQVVGIGDAENDIEFLSFCGTCAAVANALDTVKRVCPIIASAISGDGVTQVIDEIIANDLSRVANRKVSALSS